MLHCTVPEEMSDKEAVDGFSSLLSSGSNIFKDCNVEIDLQSRPVSFDLLAKIHENFITPSECVVKCWITSNDKTRSFFESIGLKTNAEERKNDVSASDAHEANDQSAVCSARTGYVYFGNLRSGQSIKHSCDVIVLGNVNTGSEIIASGNVTVLGRLCGVVHAGCEGDCNKVVITRSLEAGQVRIGTKVSMLEDSSPFWRKAVSLKIEDNKVQVCSWPDLL